MCCVGDAGRLPEAELGLRVCQEFARGTGPGLQVACAQLAVQPPLPVCYG